MNILSSRVFSIQFQKLLGKIQMATLTSYSSINRPSFSTNITSPFFHHFFWRRLFAKEKIYNGLHLVEKLYRLRDAQVFTNNTNLL